MSREALLAKERVDFRLPAAEADEYIVCRLAAAEGEDRLAIGPSDAADRAALPRHHRIIRRK